jgi:hypothetical protein
MAFPLSPVDGQVYNDYKYDIAIGGWDKIVPIELVNDSFLHKETTGIMIPYYAYPTDVYTNVDIAAMMDFKRKNKTVPIMVILNPENGAGTIVDGNYTYAIKMLKGSGCNVIGYVSTNYTITAIETVKADIDKWIELYPDTEGIFLDEMSWEDETIKTDYYKELNRYIKSLGMIVTVANPGANVTESYVIEECADIFMDWESAAWPADVDMQQLWNDGSSSHSLNKRCCAVYDGLLDGGWNDVVFDKVREYYGWVYYTEDTTANPWDSLSTFMETMLDRIVGIDIQTDVENNPATQLSTKIPKNITQAYTNLVQDPTDLTTANWSSASGGAAEITTQSINGNLFTKVYNTTVLLGTVRQPILASFTNLILTGSVICRKGDDTQFNSTLFIVYNTTTLANLCNVSINFDNIGSVPVLASAGSILGYKVIDSETVEVFFKCLPLTALTDDVWTQCHAGSNVSGEYTYWSEVQLIDSSEITMYPFISGSKTADVISETFTMPDRFTFDTVLEPLFPYDTASDIAMFSWDIDTNNRLLLFYQAGGDRFWIFWVNGGTYATLEAQQMGDTFTNLNQRLRITGSLNLISGGVSDSRLIITPLDSGAQYETTTWTATPNIKTGSYPTLDIGYETTLNTYADSTYEYLRIYKGLLVGDVTESSDVDTILQTQRLLFDANIDEFNGEVIPAGTPTATTIEKVQRSLATGTGIEDGAILDRHIQSDVLEGVIQDAVSLQDGKVNNTGDESIAGIKTFTSNPLVPATLPTTDYQVAHKLYVDTAITDKITASVDAPSGGVDGDVWLTYTP